MPDLLTESALAYEQLVKTQYRFALGKKGKLYSFVLLFPVEGYHHLAGFQYARSIAQLANKKSALSMVLSHTVTQQDIVNSGCFSSLEGRLEGICNLPRLIEQNRIVFRYRGHEKPGSRIRAEYLLTHCISTQKKLHFFINSKSPGFMVPVSLFDNPNGRYEINCPKVSTLSIEKNYMGNGWVSLYNTASFIGYSPSEQ